MTIRGKPSVEAFLDGSNKDQSTEVVSPSKNKRPLAAGDLQKRTRKLFELPEVMVADLEQRCVDERRQLGRRVTQTEIVERALETYLYRKQ